MAKYLIKEDYEVAWVRPSNGTTANAIFSKGNIIEAAISPVDGALVTRVDGTMPTFKDGEVIVKVNEAKVELIPDKSAEDLAKKQNTMKYIYLGGAALLLWWFIYGREKDKKKYSETSPGYAGIKKKYTEKELTQIASDYAYITGEYEDRAISRLLDPDFTDTLLPKYLKTIKDYEEGKRKKSGTFF